MSSKEQRESAPSTLKLDGTETTLILSNHSDRIRRLEKIYEKLYHEIELENIYLPRLADVLIKYFPRMGDYRKEIDIMMRIHKGFLDRIENALQEHFEYHSHTDKKTNKDSNYIYSSIKEEGSDEKLHSD